MRCYHCKRRTERVGLIGEELMRFVTRAAHQTAKVEHGKGRFAGTAVSTLIITTLYNVRSVLFRSYFEQVFAQNNN